MIGNLSVSDTTVNSIEVQWEPPREGGVDTYEIEFTCMSPNKDSVMNRTQKNSTQISSVTAIGLDPGTSCSVKVITRIGNQTGDPYTVRLNQTSKEMGKYTKWLSSLLKENSLK